MLPASFAKTVGQNICRWHKIENKVTTTPKWEFGMQAVLDSATKVKATTLLTLKIWEFGTYAILDSAKKKMEAVLDKS